jgi:hypothetical protein
VISASLVAIDGQCLQGLTDVKTSRQEMGMRIKQQNGLCRVPTTCKAWMPLCLVAALSILGCSSDEVTGGDTHPLQDQPRLNVTSGTLHPDENGELYPEGSPPAEIGFYRSTFDNFTCDYLSGCSVEVRGLHRGIWNHTSQKMVVLVDNQPHTPEQSTNEFGCRQWRTEMGREVCVEKEADNAETFFFDVCGTTIRGRTVHSAWWTGRWEAGVGVTSSLSLNLGIGPHGMTHRTSMTAASIQVPQCRDESEGGGGEGGGDEEECFHVYGVWYDPETNEIMASVYLYTYCTGGNVS